MAITALPTPPTRDDPTNFAARGDAFLAALPAFATEANAQADTVNTQTALATSSAAVAGASAQAALGAANYKGLWSSLTGALSVPASVTHNDVAWLLINNVADVTLSQPGVSADWIVLNTQSFEIGDIKQSTVAQGAKWLPCDGSEYTTATYPTLGAALPNTAYEIENSSATMTSLTTGTIAYNGTNTYVMSDASGCVSSSTDGVTWVERLFANAGGSGGALTYAGGYFCYPTTSGFYYSADGITWAFKFLLATATIREVRFGAGVFVALSSAASSNIWYSATVNGTYTNTSAGGSAQFRLFFFGTRFYTLGEGNATTNVSSSPDGATWTAAAGVAPSQSLFDMDYDGAGNYVVVGSAGHIWYSANGTSWTQATGTGGNTYNKVKFANSLWIALDQGTGVSTSTNTSTWTARTTGLTASYGIAFGNGKWVVASTTSGTKLAHSTDGITWSFVTAYKFENPSTTRNYVPLIFAGGKFVFSNTTAGVVHTATDPAGVWTVGRNQKWIGLNANSSNENWYADTGTGSLMLPVGTGVVVTTNGSTYTYRATGLGGANGLNHVFYAAGAFYLCGNGTQTLYRSTDGGANWTSVSSASGYTFTSTNYNGVNQYLATMSYDGSTGKVRTSTDGVTWTERSVGGNLTFQKSVWFNNAWLLLSSSYIYRSTDGINWVLVLSDNNIQTIKVVNGILYVLAAATSFKSTDGLGFTKLDFQGNADTKYDIEYFNSKYVITAKPYTDTTLQLRNTIWSSTDGTLFFPVMMPQEYSDNVMLLKTIGSTLYALGTYWIYTSKDGVTWARFSIPRISAFGRSVALINFQGKVVLHTTNAAFPVSATKFRVPELTLQLGAPSFIKATN